MGHAVKVFLLNVKSDRPVFYYEAPAEDDHHDGDPTSPPKKGFRARFEAWFHRLKAKWQHSHSGAVRFTRAQSGNGCTAARTPTKPCWRSSGLPGRSRSITRHP